jgi:hypothetical protein
MKKAKLELQKKTVADLIQLARHIVLMMTGNVNFTTPNPALADITAKALALETAYEASLEGNHAKVAESNQLKQDLKHLLSFLAMYVNNIAQGDVQKIFSSGMELSKDSEPVGMLPAPGDVRLEKGSNEGKIFVRFTKVENAKSYEIDYSESAETQLNLPDNLEDIPWEHAGTSTGTKFEITGLSSGNRILVRVAAVNAEGQGTWSDPATMVVP